MYNYIHERGPLPEIQVVRMIQQIMSAMIYLTDTFDVVHRDIKPENILIFKKDLMYDSLEDRFYKSIQRENELDFKLCGMLFLSLCSLVDFGFSDKHGICGTECFSFLFLSHF